MKRVLISASVHILRFILRNDLFIGSRFAFWVEALSLHLQEGKKESFSTFEAGLGSVYLGHIQAKGGKGKKVGGTLRKKKGLIARVPTPL